MDTQKAIELNRKIIRIVTIIGIILTIILGWLVAKNDYLAIDGPFRDYSGRLNLCHRAYRIRASSWLDL